MKDAMLKLRPAFAALVLTGCLAQIAIAQPQTGGKYEIDGDRAMRPKGYQPNYVFSDELVREGKAMFSDPKIGKTGDACSTCHANFNTFTRGFAEPFPHAVGLVKRKTGIDAVQLDEMIQYCMIVPLGTDPWPWGSRQLNALIAYVTTYQAEYRKLVAEGAIKTPSAR